MSDTANAERGEAEIVLDGRVYVMRPSFEAMMAFEAATGKSTLALAGLALEQDMAARDVAEVAAACIKAQGEAVNDPMLKGINTKRIGALIMETRGGFAYAQARLGKLLLGAATGGYDAKGEPRAAAETAQEPTAAD